MKAISVSVKECSYFLTVFLSVLCLLPFSSGLFAFRYASNVTQGLSVLIFQMGIYLAFIFLLGANKTWASRMENPFRPDEGDGSALIDLLIIGGVIQCLIVVWYGWVRL